MPAESADRRARFEFTGDSLEYFRIWIVNVLFSIVTLGIYSAWAKVRTKRYFYGNLVVDGHRFAYHADPVRILKGRIIAVLALAAYFVVWHFQPAAGPFALTALVLVLPAVLVLAVGFNLRNSSHRNIRFAFRRDIGGIYRILMWPIVIVLGLTWAGYLILANSAAGVALAQADETGAFAPVEMVPTIFFLALAPLVPYIDFLRTRFTAANAAYGSQPMQYNGGCGGFYRVHMQSGMVMFAVMAIVSFIFILVGAAIQLIGGAAGADETAAEPMGAITIGMIVAFYVSMLIVLGYFQARRTNLVYNNLTIGRNYIHSALGARRLAWLYVSNAAAIIASVGMLVPWAKVRVARYRAQCTELQAHEIDRIAAAAAADRTALGEEMGDAFGFDLGF